MIILFLYKKGWILFIFNWIKISYLENKKRLKKKEVRNKIQLI